MKKLRPTVTMGVLDDGNKLLSAADQVEVSSSGDDHEASVTLRRGGYVLLGLRVGIFVDTVLVRTFLVKSGAQMLTPGQRVVVRWRGTL